MEKLKKVRRVKQVVIGDEMSRLLEEIKVYGDLTKISNFEVVTLHPLADETIILDYLNMSPNECKHCDLYWVFKDRIFFVSIVFSQRENPLLTYHLKSNIKYGHSFYIITNIAPLYTETVKVALEYLSNWIIDNDKLLEKRITGVLKITDLDICSQVGRVDEQGCYVFFSSLPSLA